MKCEIVGKHDSGGITRAFLILGCDRQCQIPLRRGEPRMGASKVWGWDGKEEGATVSPSIDCTQCGFHKTLVQGQWQ